MGYRFDDHAIAHRHDLLASLVQGLERFADLDPATGLLAAMLDRLATYPLPETVEKQWQEAIASVRNPNTRPVYGGLALERVPRLFPVGRDPDSGLWEFVHLWTGKVPERDSTSGRLRNSDQTGLILVLLPGATFDMGAQRDDPHKKNYDPRAQDDEAPVHEVTLGSFLIAKHEVRQAIWERVMGENPSRFKGAFLPVEMVSWDKCREFSEMLGLALPTEAQWEYACRAETSWPYAGSGKLHEMGWYEDNSEGKTHPVGEKTPNAFGLHDMHGNVWEWCEDSVADLLTNSHSHRVIRSGSWKHRATNCRSSRRQRSDPWIRFDDFGFRPSRSLQE